jgi:hypothetical protein
MNYPDISRDPPRDDELAAMLVTALPDGADEMDGARLRTAIMTRARDHLARLRRQPLWWEYAASWAKPAVPLALAAALALAFVLGSIPMPASSPATEVAVATLPSLEDVLTHQLPDAEYNLLLSRSGDTDALLNFALQESR